MSFVTFRLKDDRREYDLREPEPAAVITELTKIGSAPALAVSAEIQETLRGGRSQIVELARPGQCLALLRALDHIRNGAKVDRGEAIASSEALLGLRTALFGRLGEPAVTYDLTTREKGSGTFFSYSGHYEAGDRLVTAPDGREWKVTSSEQPEGTSRRGRLEARN